MNTFLVYGDSNSHGTLPMQRLAETARAAEMQGCGFVDADTYIEVSEVDGVYWGAPSHMTFGAAMADLVAARLKAGT